MWKTNQIIKQICRHRHISYHQTKYVTRCSQTFFFYQHFLISGILSKQNYLYTFTSQIIYINKYNLYINFVYISIQCTECVYMVQYFQYIYVPILRHQFGFIIRVSWTGLKDCISSCHHHSFIFIFFSSKNIFPRVLRKFTALSSVR